MSKTKGYLLLAALLCASVGLAQGMLAPAADPPAVDPSRAVEMRVNMLAKLLNLSDSQKATATAIFNEAQNASQSLRSNLLEARKTMTEAIKSNNIGAIDNLAATIGALSGQLEAIEGKAQAAFYAILTSEQRAIYDALPPGGLGGSGVGRGPGRAGGPGGFQSRPNN